MKSEKRKLVALNRKLTSILDEQIELDIFLNPLVNWNTGCLYKEHLDNKYVGREFDISYVWKKKVKDENYKKEHGGNWDEEILNDNETKRDIFLKLSKRKKDLSIIIIKIIEEIELLMGIDQISDDQMAEIFK